MTTKFARFEAKRCQETLLEYSLMLKDGRIWMTLFWQDLFLLRTVNGEALDRQVLMFCKRISMAGWKCFIQFTIIFSDKDTFDQWHNNMPPLDLVFWPMAYINTSHFSMLSNALCLTNMSQNKCRFIKRFSSCFYRQIAALRACLYSSPFSVEITVFVYVYLKLFCGFLSVIVYLWVYYILFTTKFIYHISLYSQLEDNLKIRIRLSSVLYSLFQLLFSVLTVFQNNLFSLKLIIKNR